jgi:biotin--protein ligase
MAGCGINTTNSTPTTSLLDLIAAHNAAHRTALPHITQEELLALILPRFEAFWARFSASGSSFGMDTASAGDFSSFADAYTRRWLHTGKIVTVQASGQTVRILGLHPDSGTLRTIELDEDGRERVGQYVDLEPDGNSFDMMQGLLKVKR